MKYKVIVTALLFTGILSAKTISINNGWQLLGAAEDISTQIFDDSGCVDYLWKYDVNTTAAQWRLHISNDKKITTQFKDFHVIKKGEGFWAKVNSQNCKINLPDNNTTEENNSTPKTNLQRALLSGDTSLVTEDEIYDEIDKVAQRKLNSCNNRVDFIFKNGYKTADVIWSSNYSHTFLHISY